MAIEFYWWLILACALLVAIRLVDEHRRTATAAALLDLAKAAKMNFSAIDRFDLARRLQDAPAWTAGLNVRDVLYGASATGRTFVATVEHRATADDEPRVLVIACAEPLDHSELRPLGPPTAVKGRRAVVDAYRATLASIAG